MILATSAKNIFDELSSPGTKLVYIFLENCPACASMSSTIAGCQITTNTLVDKSIRCDKFKAAEFCRKFDIQTVPTVVLFSDDSKEISRLSFAPNKEQYLDWLIDNLAG